MAFHAIIKQTILKVAGLDFNYINGRDGRPITYTISGYFKPNTFLTEYAYSTRDEKNVIYFLAIFFHIIRPLGYERVYMPLCKVSDTPF